MFRNKPLLAVLLVFTLLTAACSNRANDAQPSGGASSPGASATATASATPANVELRMAWWGAQERHDKTLAVIELFESRHPNIKITAEYSGFDGYFDKLNTQIAAGNAPDLIQMGGNIKEYVDRNALLDLQPYVGSLIKLDDFGQSLIDEATFDGKFYGVTLGVSQTGLLYNASMFNKAGVPIPDENWTFDDFKNIALEISRNLGDGHYGSYDLSSDNASFTTYLGAYNKELYRDGELRFDKQDVVNWFTLWDELRQAGAIVPPETQVANPPDAVDKSLIVKGQVAIQGASASQIFGYQDVTEDQLGLLSNPTGPAGNGMSPPISGQFITSYQGTDHPEEVAMFIDFMVNDPEAAAILGSTRGVPPSSVIRDALAAQSTPVDKVMYDYISLATRLSEGVLPFEHFPYDNEYINLLKVTSEKVAFGASSIDAAADEFMSEMQKMLARSQ
ncbi:ABC transporter substrate-binding protein [Paenibacillaceae bacterium WGS1546]|uniref:ABC transporter substrate-binding protein n=1 Tax=Cohnella sp. WGS1546 TaxID=3366810 RepID=UPI00372D77C1